MSQWMRNGRALVAAGLVAIVSACGGGQAADPEFVEASPDFEGLALELSGDDGTNADGSMSSPLEADVSVEAALAPDAPQLLPAVRQTVRGINHIVARFVRHIERIVRESPDVATGTTHTWTRADASLEYRFTMTKVGGKRYSFELEARAAGGTGEFTGILSGEMAKGTVAHRGAGFIDCDLTALHGLEAGRFEATGRLKVVYAHAGAMKRIRVKLIDFRKTPEAQVANAAYVYTRVGRGLAGAIKLAIHANLDDPTKADRTAAEWLLIRGRWMRDFVARFDAVAFGGDIPAGTWVRGRECLDATEHARFKLVVWRHPGTGTGSTLLAENGTISACAPGLRTDPSASELPETQAEAEAEANSEAEIEAPAE